MHLASCNMGLKKTIENTVINQKKSQLKENPNKKCVNFNNFEHKKKQQKIK